MSNGGVDLSAIGHGIASAAMEIDGVGQSLFTPGKRKKTYNNNPKPLQGGRMDHAAHRRKYGPFGRSGTPSGGTRHANVKPPSVNVLGAGSGSRVPTSN